MIKQIIVTLFFGYTTLFALSTQVFAHTLKIDGNIGVNLHVDPDDTPVAGSESKFLIDIQDKSGRFNPNNPTNCECVLTILQSDSVLKTLPVTAGGTYAQLRFTFPTSGVYRVVVEGKPRGEGVPFQSFRTNFEYYVQPGDSEMTTVQTSQNPLEKYTPYIVLIVGILIILMFVL